MNRHPHSEDSPLEEPPPIFSTWQQMYLTELGNLVLMVAVMYLVTRYFS